MIQQLASLVRDGKLNGLVLKVTLENDQPVLQLTADTLTGSHDVFADGHDDARNAVIAIRQALATPVVFRGDDIEQSIMESIPVLRSSHETVQNTLTGLNVAAKLDTAVAKAEAAQEAPTKAAAPSKAKAKPKAKVENTESAAEPVEAAQKIEAEPEPVQTPTANQFDFGSL